MSPADIVIVVVVVLIAALIIFFRFRKKNSSCSGCSYAKGCDSYCAKIEPKTDDELSK